MTFEVFLPESLADWLRKKIADGVYTDATEAAYLAIQDLRELDRHPEVRCDLLGAMINDALKEPVETFTIEEVRFKLRALRREYADNDPPSEV
jgi:Arc/MetJ-type ribon-helix-helix transcriptional regulator